MVENMLEKAGGLWFLLIAALLIGYLAVFYFNPPSCLYQLLAYVITAAVIFFIPIKCLESYTNQQMEAYEMQIQQETRLRQMARDNAVPKLLQIRNLRQEEIISEEEYTNWRKEILSEIGLRKNQ